MWIHTGGEHKLTRSAYGLEVSVEGELEDSESLDEVVELLDFSDGEVEASELLLLGDVLVSVGLADCVDALGCGVVVFELLDGVVFC